MIYFIYFNFKNLGQFLSENEYQLSIEKTLTDLS